MNTQNALAGRRILVGPNEIAGVTSRIAVALARNGARVRFFAGHVHPFDPHVSESANLRRLFGRWIATASRWRGGSRIALPAAMVLATCAKALAFVHTCAWAQAVVMIGGKGFFAGGWEYAFFRLLGKRVIHVFVGTASRPRYLSGYANDVVRDGVVNEKKLKRLARRTKRQASRVRSISRHASVVVENPLCGHFQTRPFVNWFKLGVPLDVDELTQRPRITTNTPPRAPGKVRVLHCPSRPEVKGSARIQAAVETLITEGLPLEYRQVTGVPHGQVLHEIVEADFVVDQLYSDTPLAGFAAEASAFGKAAVVGGYGWNLFAGFLPPAEMPPTALCHPDALEDCLRSLVADPARREEIGANAREFLQTQWSETAFAARFARIVQGDIPSDSLVRPEHVRHLHGAGIEETQVKQLIAAMVSRIGPASLQLDHLPKLRDALTAFSHPASRSPGAT